MNYGGTALPTARRSDDGRSAPAFMVDLDQQFWMDVRRGLLQIVRAIENRYGLKGPRD